MGVAGYVEKALQDVEQISALSEDGSMDIGRLLVTYGLILKPWAGLVAIGLFQNY